MNLENGLRILENIGFPKNPTKISFCGQISPTQFSPPPPLRLEIATSAALRACAARCARCALPPLPKKKGANFLEGCFLVAICSRGPVQAPEISRPGAPASAKLMAWAILNGKSLAWASEKYEKSSPGRDFHPKNALAWTSSNGKFLRSFGFRVWRIFEVFLMYFFN